MSSRCLLVVVLLLPTTVRADETAKELFRQGQTHYRLSNFSEALAKFQQVLKRMNRPSVVLNIAQCHRQLEQHEKALFYYKLYLTEWARKNPEKPSPYLREVEQHISKLKVVIDAARAALKKKELEKKKQPEEKPPGKVHILGHPAGAIVAVSAKSSNKAIQRGRLPLMIELDRGSYKIEISNPGYRSLAKWIWVERGSKTEVRVKLKKRRTTIRIAKDGSLMKLVPRGKFRRGSFKGTGQKDEYPRRLIYLDGFYIDKYEVSVAQYQRCVTADACLPPPVGGACNWGQQGREQYPINCVDRDQAKEYCRWAGKRLPTEAEWEKAAVGVEHRIYPWGNKPISCSLAKYRLCKAGTVKVTSFGGAASPYGVVQMVGNVAEWVNDWYAKKYYAIGPDRNPKGPRSGRCRIARGGSFQSTRPRPTERIVYCDVSVRYVDNGIRCARDLTD